MRKYFTKAHYRTDEYYLEPLYVPSMTVHESEKCQFTGLLDVDGNALYASNSQPIGFVLTEE